MAYKTVGQVRDNVSAILSGINLNNVQNLNGAFERTARELATKIYIPEVQGKTAITLYDGVIDYSAPTDIFGASLVDMRIQGQSRSITDYVLKKPIAIFDRVKAWLETGYQIAFEFVKGVGRVRIVSTKPTPRIQLDSLNDTTGWANGGSAGAITKDSTVIWQAPASLRFTLTGSSTGTLTKTITQQDLTDYVGVGVVFLAMRTPSISNLTSITIRIGSSSSNYYEVTSTVGFLGAWTVNEWLLTAFDLSGASTTGSPTVTAIKYAQIRIAHTGTITNFYVGDLFISLPSPHDMIYQTASFFQASGSNPSNTIVNSADSVLLNDSALVLYEHECAITIANQQGGTLANGLIATISQKLNGIRGYRGIMIQVGLYDIYRANNPSEELKLVGNYYDD